MIDKITEAKALVAAMDERGAAWHGHYDALYVEAMDKAADACIALVRGWPQDQAVDDAICAVCDGTREYVQPCPGCAETKVDGMYPQEMCERMAAPEGWKYVPVEPTEAMLKAMTVAMSGGWLYPEPGEAQCVYEAMLAAAPAQEDGN